MKISELRIGSKVLHNGEELTIWSICGEKNIINGSISVNDLEHKPMDILGSVKEFNECIVEVPHCEVIIDGISQGMHNELTVRKLSLAIYNNELENKKIELIFNGKTYVMNSIGKINPYMTGFYDLTYKLAFEML
jgi:hypothetical protein